jgi:hypothetical protein
MDAGRIDGARGKADEKIIFTRMAILKGKANAGQGGKIGHSNQDHWQFTEEIKAAARKWRRLQAKAEIAAGLAEIEPADETEQSKQARL